MILKITTVRTKAKFRSIGSRAETASTIAEAEMAVKTMRGRIADNDPEGMADFNTAEQLLTLSTRAFSAGNDEGAVQIDLIHPFRGLAMENQHDGRQVDFCRVLPIGYDYGRNGPPSLQPRTRIKMKKERWAL